MPEFLALLANLYLCDAIYGIRHPTMQEVAACQQSRTAVYTYFAPAFELAPEGTPERAAQMAEAQVAFEAWEAANSNEVRNMRDGVWISVRRTGATLFWHSRG